MRKFPWRWLCAGLVFVIVLAGGYEYAKSRKPTYQSTVKFVLVPSKKANSVTVAGNLLDTIQTSGALGTFVELISARATQQSPTYTFTVRSIPDSRVIVVTSEGAKAGVQGSLDNIVASRKIDERLLRDLWQMAVLQLPTAPVKAGASKTTILLATAAIALLAAIGVLLLFGQLMPKAPPPAGLQGGDHEPLALEPAGED